jgi:hypothetical protein
MFLAFGLSVERYSTTPAVHVIRKLRHSYQRSASYERTPGNKHAAS